MSCSRMRGEVSPFLMPKPGEKPVLFEKSEQELKPMELPESPLLFDLDYKFDVAEVPSEGTPVS